METPRRALRNFHAENVEQLCTPLKIPPSPFMKNLGYGTGVNVYRLDRSPKCGQIRSPFAVKQITQRARTTENLELFNARIQREADILRKLSHPNIVGFRGITKTTDGFHTLALECCKTSLGSILEERNEDELGPLPAKETLKMIADIACALDYIHTEAKLLHGDMKSYNILVKGDFEICKLCDFGVSLPMNDNGLVDTTKNRYVGTDVWSAPEVIDELELIDCKADIFSFGLVIYETIALVPPHVLDLNTDEEDEENTDKSTIENTEDNSDFESKFLERIDIACGTRPPLPQAFELSDEYNLVVEFFYCCTNELAENRPTAKVIWGSLKKVEDKEN